jgi:serine/threonine protein kinase
MEFMGFLDKMVYCESGKFDPYEEFFKEYDESYGNKIGNLPTQPCVQGNSESLVKKVEEPNYPTNYRFEGEVDGSRYVDRVKKKKGAHSVIYTARDTRMDRIVGLKKHLHAIPLSEEADAKEIRTAEKRFRSEAGILGKMRHPSMMGAYALFFEDEEGEKVPYLVMEYILEESLADKLERGEPFSEPEVRELILSVGTGIDYMHRFTGNGHPIIYRDLKPDNIKVMRKDADWPHKIVDFSESKVGNATILSGSVVGTPGFNAPEIYGGGEADERTDRYSLARMGIAMVLPDREKFNETWLGNLTLEGLANTGDLRVSDDLLRVFEKATAKSADERYPTFLDMIRDLGYNIERTPRTREELEQILRNKSLAPEIQTDLKQVREMDGWIHQARASQGLEERVQEVSLTKGEEGDIEKKARKITSSLGVGIGAIPMFLAAHFGFLGDVPGFLTWSSAMCLFLGGYGTSIIGGYYPAYTFLTKRALREKRINMGIDPIPEKPKMQEYATMRIPGRFNSKVNNFLSEKGFEKKGIFRGKMVKEGVSVKTIEHTRSSSVGGLGTSSETTTYVDLNAINLETAGPLIKDLSDAFEGTFEYIHPDLKPRPVGIEKPDSIIP